MILMDYEIIVMIYHYSVVVRFDALSFYKENDDQLS